MSTRSREAGGHVHSLSTPCFWRSTGVDTKVDVSTRPPPTRIYDLGKYGWPPSTEAPTERAAGTARRQLYGGDSAH